MAGRRWPSTIAKEQAREALRAHVMAHFGALIGAQIQNAIGISH